jgi:hypothetical protein
VARCGRSGLPHLRSIGTPDGWHLWCARHLIVVVFPRGQREPGADEPEKELPPDLALRLLETRSQV